MTFRALILCVALNLPVAAQEESRYVPETDPLVLAQLEKWQDLKFGLLMHWGPYSQWGVVESWSICAEDEDWCRRKTDDYVSYKKEYEGLKGSFNPLNFDPTRWSRAARDAGMKYVVFTTKHHDGFAMFDTKETSYRITDPGCPFSRNPKADVTRAIFEAFRDQGLWVGAYFSKPDWHSEYYWWPNFATPDRNANYDIKQYPERWEKFVRYTHAQLEELTTGYGRVDILWLDGGWVRPMMSEEVKKYINGPDYKFTRVQSQDIRMEELVRKVRRNQPGIIVVDRAVPGKNQNYLTPENAVPDQPLLVPWESCIISGGGWSWTPDAHYMDPAKAIRMLVDIVAKGGNLLLNVAPGPDGSWDEGAYALLKEIGGWLRINGRAIYGTRPLIPYNDGRIYFTRRGEERYVIYITEDDVIPAELELKSLSMPKGNRVSVLGASGTLEWRKSGGSVFVTIPPSLREDPPSRFGISLFISP